jgi:hypothetical protein
MRAETLQDRIALESAATTATVGDEEGMRVTGAPRGTAGCRTDTATRLQQPGRTSGDQTGPGGAGLIAW